MIGRRSVLCGCCALVAGFVDRPASAGQGRLGPFSIADLESRRARYEPFLRGLFFEDLLARLPPAMRAPLGEVRLDLPAETTADLDADPAFVLNVGAIPAQRRVILPLRTVVWLHEYLGLTAHLQGSQCSNWLILALIYPGMLTTQRPGGARPPGPLAAFGLDESIYDDVVVNNETNKLSASIVFFLLAHELGHIALRHATGATGIHSQLQETRADAYALDAMANVGLAPFGLAIFFSAAAMMEGVQNTHPLSGSRVDAALRDFEARPLAFVDRSEQDPESWLPRLKKLSREVREAIPLADDPERRAGILKIAAGADFPRLREIQEFACRG